MNDPLATFVGNIVAPFKENLSKITKTEKSTVDPLTTFFSTFKEKAEANKNALLSKSPFLQKLGADTNKIVTTLGSAADESIKKNAENVKLFAKGKLPVSVSDVGSGALSTVEGIGRLAQGFNAGLVRILKSGAQSVVGKEAVDKAGANPLLSSFRSSVAGNEKISSYQDIYAKANDYALENKATPAGAKIFATSAVLGSLFIDNPFFGPEGAGLKVAARTAERLAKERTEKGVVDALVNEAGIPDDVARQIAPMFKAATTPEEVHAVVAQLNQGANTARAFAEGGKPVERKFITSVKEELPTLGDRVAGQYIPRDTDVLAQGARDLINRDIDSAEKLARTGTDDKAIATAVQLIKHYTDVAETAADKATRNSILDHAADLTNNVAARLTELGRSVQAASILGRQTPEGMVRFAARTIQKFNETAPVGRRIPELSGQQMDEIAAKVKEVSNMSDGVEKAKAFKQVMDEVADLVPTPIFKKLVTVWKAGLLTGIKTSGLNTLSNLSHGISELVKDVPSVAVDRLAALFTGKRTMALTAKGLPSGFKEGVAKGWDYFKTGYDERNMRAKIDMQRVSFGNSPFAKAIQRYEETVFRILGLEDQPFYYGAKAHSMYSQALAQAKNENIKGKDLKEYVENLVANPTDDMLHNAVLDAEMAVFQNSTALGRAAAAVKEAVPLSEVVIPFSRTPASVAMQVVNYSPVGAVAEIGRQIVKGTFNQRALSQAIGRSVTGVGALYLGGQLYDKGFMSLGRPKTEREQNAQELQGEQANSIKVGDKWRQVSVLGPLGVEMLVGGYFAKGLKETGSVWGGLAQAAAGAGKSLTEQTFLSGVNEFINAINDPARSAMGLFSGLIGSLIPTIVGDVSRATDKVERKQIGILDAAKSRLPGVRQTLQPKLDTLGNEVKTPDFLTVMLDPTRPTKVNNDPTILELKRLDKEGHGVTPTKLGNKNGYKSLTAKENTELWRKTGQLIQSKLTNLFNTPQYQALNDEKKAKLIDTFVDKSKNLTRASMVLHKTQGLSGDALRKELSKQKESGLLTKTVFEIYAANR